MKTILLCLALMTAGAARSLAADNPAAQQLLDTAHKPADLFNHATAPFEIEFEFSTPSQVPQQNRFLLRWKAKDQWWSKAIYGPYQQITIRNGEMEYTERNVDLTPMAVRELFNLLHVRDDFTPWIAKKVKDRSERGLTLTCIRGQQSETKVLPHDFCLERVSHQLRSEEWEIGTQKTQQQFSDYTEFQGVQFPRKLQFLFNGTSGLSANLLRLEPTVFNPVLLTPPKGAIERRRCPGLKPPEPMSIPDVSFDGLGIALKESTVVSLTILTNGSVGDVQLVASGGPTLDQRLLTRLKNWKFKPAMCGNEPVVFDSEVTVYANLH